MQPHTSTTPDSGLVGSLWIDQTHKHRLVEVIRVIDQQRVLLQPIRDAHQRPASYLETTKQLQGHSYHQVTP